MSLIIINPIICPFADDLPSQSLDDDPDITKKHLHANSKVSRSRLSKSKCRPYIHTYIHTTTDNLEWPWMAVSSASCTMSTVAELLVYSILHRNDRVALQSQDRLPESRLVVSHNQSQMQMTRPVATGLGFAMRPRFATCLLHMAGAYRNRTDRHTDAIENITMYICGRRKLFQHSKN